MARDEVAKKKAKNGVPTSPELGNPLDFEET
jgi:hypothetical protein